MESTPLFHRLLPTCVLGTKARLALVHRLSDPPQGFSKPGLFTCHSGETLWTLEGKEIAFLLATNLEQNSNRFFYCFSILPEWALSAGHVVGRAAISLYSLCKGCRTCASCNQRSLTFSPLMKSLALL